MGNRVGEKEMAAACFSELTEKAPLLLGAIEKDFIRLAFDNRSTLHPRRLKEISVKEVDAFCAFVTGGETAPVIEHGRQRMCDGLGPPTVLALADRLREFFWDNLSTEDPAVNRGCLNRLETYISTYLSGYLEELETQILREQEHLRRALSAALERQSRELQVKNHAINTSITGIILTDMEGRVDYVNRAFSTMWGYRDAKESVGLYTREIFNNDQVLENIKSLTDDGESGWRQELEVRRKDGSEFNVEISASLIKDARNQPRGVMVSLNDITARKRTEQELGTLQEHLFQAQKMEAVGTLSSGIAHDFNNILQAISGYVQRMLDRGGVDQTDRKYLLETVSAVDKAADLIHRLLTFSRKVKPALKPVNLNEVVIQTVEILEHIIPKMVGIETRFKQDRPMVYGDANQLEQVLLNLGANARDAMPDGGRLIIETEQVFLDAAYCKSRPELTPGHHVIMRVSDTGCGMEGETAKHIFEPFFTTKNVGEGTGLGLSTVYGIIKGHAGHISSYSEPGRGTIFNIYLPVARDVEIKAGAEDQPADEIRGGTETILLVDDERAILEVARDTLSDYGYTTILAESGEQVLDIYQSEGHRIDLVILDLGMPGMGGQSCLKELLNLDPGAKVIIASGYSVNGQVRDCMARGALGYIGKPYRLTEMLKTTRDVLDSGR